MNGSVARPTLVERALDLWAGVLLTGRSAVGIKKALVDCRGLSYRSAELKFAITLLTTCTQAQASCIVLAPRSTTASS
jgi:hypothetical protein